MNQPDGLEQRTAASDDRYARQARIEEMRQTLIDIATPMLCMADAHWKQKPGIAPATHCFACGRAL